MKFIVALNKKSTIPSQVNAASHLFCGLPTLLNEDQLMLRKFIDTNNQMTSILTDHPLIVFSAKNGSHIRDAHLSAIEQDIPVNAFFDCHRTADPNEQEQLVKSTILKDQDYIGIAAFGDDVILRQLTKRFSLMK